MKIVILLLATSIMVTLLFDCTPKLVPAEKPASSKAAQQQTQAVTKDGWEREWANTIKAAHREGTVVIYSPSTPNIRDAVQKAFHERFGISAQMVPGGASELAAKILAEHRANIHYVDFYMGGPSTLTPILKPQGVLAPIRPVLVLPEVLDTKLWYGDRLPFVDENGMVVSLSQAPASGFVLNTSLVKLEEVNSYRDLLAYKWKGKIIMANPARPPGGLIWFTAFVHSGTLTLDYMRALARQEPMISTDRRQVAEWLSRGKYAISIGTGFNQFQAFYEAGIPLKLIRAVEGDYLTAGAGGIGLMKKAPHSSAAKVFVNWILSKEGSTVFTAAYGMQSRRMDVSNEIVAEFWRRQPGQKYINADTEEMYLKQPEYSKIAEEIFGHLLK